MGLKVIYALLGFPTFCKHELDFQTIPGKRIRAQKSSGSHAILDSQGFEDLRRSLKRSHNKNRNDIDCQTFFPFHFIVRSVLCLTRFELYVDVVTDDIICGFNKLVMFVQVAIFYFQITSYLLSASPGMFRKGDGSAEIKSFCFLL